MDKTLGPGFRTSGWRLQAPPAGKVFHPPNGPKAEVEQGCAKEHGRAAQHSCAQHSAAWRAWDSRACLKQKWWGAGAAELRVCFRDGGPHVACHAWNNGAQLLRPLLLGSLCADYIGELRS